MANLKLFYNPLSPVYNQIQKLLYPPTGHQKSTRSNNTRLLTKLRLPLTAYNAPVTKRPASDGLKA